MRQVFQSLRNGVVELAEAPCPKVVAGNLVVRSRFSLISAGTERMLLEFGRAGWIDKALQQRDKVRQVLDKMRTDGLASTLAAVQAKLDVPLASGYSNVGVVLEVGAGVPELCRGDRVISNGGHAEVVRVPKNLCAKVPDGVAEDAAAFTVPGAIALQGIRLAQPTLGETFVVMGLGLIGLLTVQMLRAHGCRVVGIDPDGRRVDVARRFGAVTEGTEVDGVIITAATQSSEPVHRAAQMCRKRGRIVLVGVTGLELSRDDFYKKELLFQVSCSYGPGRYDPAYEDKGQDYPIAFVRWTAQRNFEAVLDLLADGRLDVKPLISHRFPFDQAEKAYDLLLSDEPHLGILLEYPTEGENPTEEVTQKTIRLTPTRPPTGTPVVNVIGAGGYATKTLLPAFQRAGVRFGTIASSRGFTAAHASRKFGFENASTDVGEILNDPYADVLVIATRHDSHARYVCNALRAGKHVFVEKPLALSEDEMAEIEGLYRSLVSPPLLMVGFNRRFAPLIVKAKELLTGLREPKSIVYTVNAGAIPPEHWTQDPTIGGGRILGEVCHFVDLMRHLAGSPITGVQTAKLAGDTVTITLRFADASIGSVHYFANGHRSVPKERLEVFCGGRILQLDNFRRLKAYGCRGFSKMNLWRQDKGADRAISAFVNAARSGGPSPIPFEELCEVTRATLAAAR